MKVRHEIIIKEDYTIGYFVLISVLFLCSTASVLLGLAFSKLTQTGLSGFIFVFFVSMLTLQITNIKNLEFEGVKSNEVIHKISKR